MTATTTSPTAEDPAPDASTFDVNEFLNRLDAVFASHSAATKAEPLLLDAMTDAENAGDFAGLLTVLNETMGFYRSQGRHQDNQWIIQRAIELALRLGLEGTEAWTTTLINAATSQRAAGNMEQAEDLYEQALILRDQDNQNIASAMSLAPSTVKVHVHNILQKTGHGNRQELIQDFWKTV